MHMVAVDRGDIENAAKAQEDISRLSGKPVSLKRPFISACSGTTMLEHVFDLKISEMGK